MLLEPVITQCRPAVMTGAVIQCRVNNRQANPCVLLHCLEAQVLQRVGAAEGGAVQVVQCRFYTTALWQMGVAERWSTRSSCI